MPLRIQRESSPLLFVTPHVVPNIHPKKETLPAEDRELFDSLSFHNGVCVVCGGACVCVRERERERWLVSSVCECVSVLLFEYANSYGVCEREREIPYLAEQ